jgi:uncharacterized tellurite resistance protein B-like protein
MGQALRTPIKAMNNRQKEWLATAMVAMVLADGNVSQGEVQSLMQSISFVQEPETVERLKKHIQFKTSPPIPTFSGWEKETKYRATMLLDLIEVAISDRDFSPPEKAKFYEIGKLLGFGRNQIDQLVQAGDKFAAG